MRSGQQSGIAANAVNQIQHIPQHRPHRAHARARRRFVQRLWSGVLRLDASIHATSSFGYLELALCVSQDNCLLREVGCGV